MKRLAVALLAIAGILTGAVAFLLNTTTGLRWVLDQVLARTGAPVEIGDVQGRLLGPASLRNVRFEAGDGTRVRLDQVRLDWQPTALTAGLLHVTGLEMSGVQYSPGAQGGGAGPAELRVPDVALPFRVQIDRLDVDSVSIGARSGEPFSIERISLRARLDGRSLALGKVTVSTARYRVDGGRLRVELAPGLPVDGSLNWRVEPEGYPVVAGTLQAKGAVGDAIEPSVDVAEPFAIHGTGTVSHLLDSPQWTLSATVPDPISLAAVRADWPQVTIRGTVNAQGDTDKARLQPDVTVGFGEMEATLEGEAGLTAHALVIDRAHAARTDDPAAVDFSGRLGFDPALPFEVRGKWQSLHGPADAPWSSPSGEFQASGNRTDLAASLSGVVTPPGNGQEASTGQGRQAGKESQIKVDFEARHLDSKPEVTGSAHVPYFAWGDIRASEVLAEVDYHPAGRETQSRVVVSAGALQVGERRAAGVTVRATGSPDQHEVSLDGRIDDWSVAAGISGAYTGGHWKGRLHQFTAQPPEGGTAPGPWQIERPADLAWTPSGYELGKLCLEHAGAKACAEGRFSPGADWTAGLEVTGVPLTWLARDTTEPLRIEGAIAARLDVANRGNGIEGTAQASIDEATLAWEGQEPVTTHYRNFQLNADLNHERLNMKLHGDLDDGGTVQGELTTREPLAGDAAIQGHVAAQLPSLRVVQAALPDLGLTQGSARLEFKIDGRRSAPELTGSGHIEQAAIALAPLGVQLKSLSLDVTSGSDRQLHLEAHASAGDGTLEARGDFGWPGGGNWQGHITVTGDRAQLVHLPQAVVAGSPDLDVAIRPGGGTVKGRIRITHAELTPEAARPKVTISDDVVVLGEEQATPATTNPMGWHAGINIDLGDDAHFKGYGVTGRLTGSLSLDAPPHQPTRATGMVEIRDGEYELYGRTFDIQKGRIVYAGGPLDKPGIEVRVGRELEDVSVSLSVGGSLANPDLQLTSTPAMSETDKMSYLLLGRPASQASGAEAGLLLRAAASLIPHGGRGVSKDIQSKLGLDTLEVRADSPDSEGASVVLGKYLSPKLYVSYIAGFQDAVDEFQVRYELARHWLLRAESSSRESGGDVLFKW